MRIGMKARYLAFLCFIACVLATTSGLLHAQGKGPGGPPSAPSPAASGGPSGMRPGGPPPASSRPTNTSGGATGGVQFGPVGRWWDDKTIASVVGINSNQKRKMDAIFNANKPAILNAYRDFLKQQSTLAAINKDPHADEESTFAAIDALNRARGELEKATAKMYLEIRQQMSSEQVDRVEKLH